MIVNHIWMLWFHAHAQTGRQWATNIANSDGFTCAEPIMFFYFSIIQLQPIVLSHQWLCVVLIELLASRSKPIYAHKYFIVVCLCKIAETRRISRPLYPPTLSPCAYCIALQDEISQNWTNSHKLEPDHCWSVRFRRNSCKYVLQNGGTKSAGIWNKIETKNDAKQRCVCVCVWSLVKAKIKNIIAD